MEIEGEMLLVVDCLMTTGEDCCGVDDKTCDVVVVFIIASRHSASPFGVVFK